MSSVLSSANASNPAVKRIMREYAEFQQSYSSGGGIDVVAGPLDDNLFEWHFTVRGPPSSPYAGGLYHGRVLLPSNYPFRPPDIVMLTPSGRFETGKKICLSISSYHPNNWQPSWSIRTALTALSAFFTTPAAGAIGSLDYPDREKQQLAAKSKDFVCPHCKHSNAHIITQHQHSSAAHTATATAPTTATPAQLTTGATNDTSDTEPPAAAAAIGELAGRHIEPPSVSLPAASNSDAPSADISRPAPQPAMDTVSGGQQRQFQSTQPTAAAAAAASPSSAHPLPLSALLARASAAQSPATASIAPQPASPANQGASSAAPSMTVSSPASSLSSLHRPPPLSAQSPLPSASARSSRTGRLSGLTVSLAVLVAALLLRKLLAHLLASQPSHASIVLHSR